MVEITLRDLDLKDALIGYLKSQAAYNKAAVERMEEDREMMAKRMAVMDEIKSQMGGAGGFVDLGQLLDDSDDDEGGEL
jgi:hypothetical protein